MRLQLDVEVCLRAHSTASPDGIRPPTWAIAYSGGRTVIFLVELLALENRLREDMAMDRSTLRMRSREDRIAWRIV
jgi:hypothetical protein